MSSLFYALTEASGLDPIALTRAAAHNLRAGKIVSGGSTITMQLMRMHQKNPERTFLQKIKEMHLSVLLEIKYSKKEILSLYVNHAPFGGNIVGLRAASWRYFGRKELELTWAESATLAVLPNSPALIHPGRNRILLRKKRNQLLKQMREREYLSQIDYELALAEPLTKKPYPFPQEANHLLATLIQKTNRKQSLFQTNIQRKLQKSMNRIVENYSSGIISRGVYNAAALIIDNERAEVISYVGNSKPERFRETISSGKDIDLVQAKRSTGSILKPILYLAMLQEGEILPR